MSLVRLALRFALPHVDIMAHRRCLFFGPHPDDIEIGAGATAARLAREGRAVRFVICTDGRYGSRTIPPVVWRVIHSVRSRRRYRSVFCSLRVKSP